MLLESKSRVQARDRIKAGRFHKLLRESFRVEGLPRELFSKTAEGPLPINKPNVENKKQAEGGPARLVRADFVKMIRMPKERADRRQQKRDCRKGRDEQSGEPEPPLAPRNFLGVRIVGLNAKISIALERRTTWVTCARA
jgi:hypothetical protein